MQKAVFDEVAGFYDLETEELKRDIPFYIDYAKKTKGVTLELGCGTGRIQQFSAKTIWEKSQQVISLDYAVDGIVLSVFCLLPSSELELPGYCGCLTSWFT